MSSSDWKGAVSNDRRRAFLTVSSADGGEVTLELDGAVNLDRLIHALGQLRSQMVPVVPPEPVESDVMMELAPATCVAKSARQNGMRQILFRHSAFGWVGFLLDDQRAAAVASALTSPWVREVRERDS